MKEKVIEILNNIKPNGDFESSVDLIADGLIDSFAVINLVGELEDEFDVEISVKDIIRENFKSVDSIVKLIEMSDED